MPATVIGTRATFGLPVNGMPRAVRFEGFPEGSRVRLRLRNDDFAQAFVKTARGITRCYVNVAVLPDESLAIVTPWVVTAMNERGDGIPRKRNTRLVEQA